MNHDQFISTAASYDRITAEYVRHIFRELEGKPFDRAMLDHFAERLRDRGVVCDMGCGPGHVARYLAERGLGVVGVDLSPGMVAQAAALNPGLGFHVGNMLALEEADETWAGIVALYSIIHISRDMAVAALKELWRVLKPGGLLLLAFHLGEEMLHVDEMWSRPVALDFWFYDTAEMMAYLHEAGFIVEEAVERDPYAPEVEHQSRRAYILARKPKDVHM